MIRGPHRKRDGCLVHLLDSVREHRPRCGRVKQLDVLESADGTGRLGCARSSGQRVRAHDSGPESRLMYSLLNGAADMTAIEGRLTVCPDRSCERLIRRDENTAPFVILSDDPAPGDGDVHVGQQFAEDNNGRPQSDRRSEFSIVSGVKVPFTEGVLDQAGSPVDPRAQPLLRRNSRLPPALPDVARMPVPGP